MTLHFIQNIGGGSILFLLIGLIYTILWIYCLVDILRSDFKDPNMKIIWIVIILFAQGIGPLVYLAMGKGTKSTYTS
ncbi:phospholipase D-like protein [Algoriphagus ratkowskyi]|uniref:PLDc_N domain-containing protein n=1 Tax=Algoriphagus ratkowskyi TaxID=57028 RepID=A0A2W7RSM5_9BACT|nr:PLD nuclease N-terminal domain-containing protein [Algoriphagus ratkowskyi]PZX58317.1 phospholipase D-like protein [Algoriphagus ratkowskyi]TXD77809.1 PLDc_N domain-containing protein [Algoriphagus ratkowskyi]